MDYLYCKKISIIIFIKRLKKEKRKSFLKWVSNHIGRLKIKTECSFHTKTGRICPITNSWLSCLITRIKFRRKLNFRIKIKAFIIFTTWKIKIYALNQIQNTICLKFKKNVRNKSIRGALTIRIRSLSLHSGGSFMLWLVQNKRNSFKSNIASSEAAGLSFLSS